MKRLTNECHKYFVGDAYNIGEDNYTVVFRIKPSGDINKAYELIDKALEELRNITIDNLFDVYPFAEIWESYYYSSSIDELIEDLDPGDFTVISNIARNFLYTLKSGDMIIIQARNGEIDYDEYIALAIVEMLLCLDYGD